VRKLAALAGVSPAYLSRIERGRRRLSDDVAERLRAALDGTSAKRYAERVRHAD